MPVSTSKASSAVPKVAIWDWAAVRRACSVRPENFGTTMAARMPRMTSTSSSSIRVKACRRQRRAGGGMFGRSLMVEWACGLLDVILEAENRQDHANEDGANEAGDEKQQQRLGERN